MVINNLTFHVLASFFFILGPDLPKNLSGHCLEPISQGLFLIDKSFQTYVYEFKKQKWQTIPSKFPCDNKNQSKVICKSFEDDLVIVPSMKNDMSCTGIFNLTSKLWIEMENDERKAPHGGFVDRLPNANHSEEILLYFGGYQNDNETIRQETKWKFNGQYKKWETYPIDLPKKLREKTTMLTLLHPDICQ